MYFHLSWIFFTDLVACLNLRETWAEIRNSINYTRAKDPPFPPGHSKINVTITFAPGAILDLDSVEQLLTFTALITVNWTDTSLSWNKSLYNGSFDIDPNQVWIPQINLMNAESGLFLLATRQFIMNLQHDGDIFADTYGMFKTLCVIDAFQFPFDDQKCQLMFDSYKGYINLNEIPQPSFEYMTFLKNDSEWSVIQMTSGAAFFKGFPYQSVTLTLKRHSLFYVLSIIIPMALTSIMNAFVFFLPAEEQISFLVSIFVSHAVFLNFVYDIMPRTSTRVPKIMIYLLCILLQSFLALLAVIATLRIRNNQVQGDCKRPSSVADKTEGNNTEVSEMKDRLQNLAAKKLDCILFVVFLSVAITNTIVFVA